MNQVAEDEIEEFNVNADNCCENQSPPSASAIGCIERAMDESIDVFLAEISPSCGTWSNIDPTEMDLACGGAFDAFDEFIDELESDWIPQECESQSVCNALVGRIEYMLLNWLNLVTDSVVYWNQPAPSSFKICDLYGYRVNDSFNKASHLIDDICSPPCS